MLGNILGPIMNWLYSIFKNYGIAIILFTLISKIILIPISIWVQKNSIKMIKIKPDINKIKIKYFGDKDKIADEEAKLYKKEKYNAFASIIPLIIQIILLLGLVEVINHPMTYILDIDKDITNEFINISSKYNPNSYQNQSSTEIDLVKDLKNDNNKTYNEELIEKIGNNNYQSTIKEINDFNLLLFGFDMSNIAEKEGGINWLIPLIAGLSALFLCIMQNKMNVLQNEQSKINKYSTLILSVSLSLYLGIFVTAGVALYWIVSNLLAVLQQWILNILINPKKYINYEELNKTEKELKSLNKNTIKRTKEEKTKENIDYKRFFSVINKHLVFYSESNGFYKYYKGIIEYILENTNINIHYITSDYNDQIFLLAKKYDSLKPYYIGEKKLITLMMKMDADVVVMTMPDLENFHIKRSYIKKDIEYIYIPHGMDSLNLTMRTNSMDHYDTIFSANKYQTEEHIKTNEYYHLKRKIFKWGYSLLDEMKKNYYSKQNNIKNILIAPSWQKDNIIDLCLDNILEKLKGKDYNIIVRPHPQQVKHMEEYFDKMKETYKNTNIIIETDFSSNETIYNADLLITDWSGIAYEYAFTTKKPVLFIDTPMKIMNNEYKNIKVKPFNIWAREVIGEIVKIEYISNIDKTIEKMLKSKKDYAKKIENLEKDLYNIGNSSEIGAKYIINSIQEKINTRKEQK